MSPAPDTPTTQQDAQAREKAERKAAKKAAAAERAAERQRIAQEKAAQKAAEKAKLVQEKAAEKERLAAIKQEQERLEKEKEKEIERAKADPGRSPRLGREKTVAREAARADSSKKSSNKISEVQKPAKRTENASSSNKSGRPVSKAQLPAASAADPPPLLSKKPKKNKPIAKPIKVIKEGEPVQEELVLSAIQLTEIPQVPTISLNTSSSNSRAHSVERNSPTLLEDIFDELDICYPWMDLINHPIFDLSKVNPAAKMPLEYGPLVHALSALSVGGGSFANNMPSGSIDNAVSSFQQLLETLTQTISDLLRLLPRTTWDDSSSFDGVLRDMLKGDDFLDDAGDEGHSKEDEVAALTLALERRARWMEVQLSKLEELHRDINMAAVRAILSFNDNGWDRSNFLPRLGNSLRRYDSIGMVGDNGVLRPMNVDMLEKKLIVAKEAVTFAEAEVREAMVKMQAFKPLTDYYY
ncbi:hypothetical protein AMATHDRAFT_176753 [Amanita thiersii Skay4041]|uniref:Uncharacterized protein n=1 Tax=Amanita thiersii Skay4041 TaxID=703135 RepID=A0A2A9NI77_9AGAR|nr:hypothetical protein AMATHDRAFT_176753 [Amanita thiersii Skay4041]